MKGAAAGQGRLVNACPLPCSGHGPEISFHTSMARTTVVGVILKEGREAVPRKGWEVATDEQSKPSQGDAGAECPAASFRWKLTLRLPMAWGWTRIVM